MFVHALGCATVLVHAVLVGLAGAHTAGEIIARVNFGPDVEGYTEFDSSALSTPVMLDMATSPIEGTTEAAAYSTHAWNSASFTYSVPVESEMFNVRLGFAEIYFCGGNGQRVFTASVSGKTITDINVFQEVGCNHAYDVTFENVKPVDGIISITLAKGSDENPMISNFEVVATGVMLTDSESTASEPTAAEPVATEPTAAEPVATEPIAAEPVATEPIPEPVEPTAPAPVVTPTPGETSEEPVIISSGSGVPKFVADWQSIDDYPESIGEGMGTVLGNDLILAGGFVSGTGFDVTNAVYARKVAAGSQPWRELPSLPFGYSHGAQVAGGSSLYICGGYKGKHPGQAMTECFFYTMGSGLWGNLPDLPEPRGGGGMVYIGESNSLFFSGGAVRPGGEETTVDHQNSWMLDLGNTGAGWVAKSDIPNGRNHMSAVSVDGRHFFVGGQNKGQEANGNESDLDEYVPSSDTWFSKADMPFGIGHISASTPKYGSGFFVVGGAINGSKKTDTVLYYSLGQNQWFDIGKHPEKVPTPVCGVKGDQLICATAYSKRGYIRSLTF